MADGNNQTPEKLPVQQESDEANKPATKPLDQMNPSELNNRKTDLQNERDQLKKNSDAWEQKNEEIKKVDAQIEKNEKAQAQTKAVEKKEHEADMKKVEEEVAKAQKKKAPKEEGEESKDKKTETFMEKFNKAKGGAEKFAVVIEALAEIWEKIQEKLYSLGASGLNSLARGLDAIGQKKWAASLREMATKIPPLAELKAQLSKAGFEVMEEGKKTIGDSMEKLTKAYNTYVSEHKLDTKLYSFSDFVKNAVLTSIGYRELKGDGTKVIAISDIVKGETLEKIQKTEAPEDAVKKTNPAPNPQAGTPNQSTPAPNQPTPTPQGGNQNPPAPSPQPGGQTTPPTNQ